MKKNIENIKKNVRDAYAGVAKGTQAGCGCNSCGADSDEFARKLGYSDKELQSIPSEANLGLSCGNPTAIASLRTGDTVLDLGSGAGFDCFIAAKKVGPEGKVIGVDMTPEMIDRARENAHKQEVTNVEFRLGEIESLPVADNSIDVVISNCVINLSPDKDRVFKEIYRVLKPGGRIAISDTALTRDLPTEVQNSIAAYTGCVSGAILVNNYKKMVKNAGLKGVKITVKGSSCITPDTNDPIGKGILKSLEKSNLEESNALAGLLVSVNVEGHK